LVSSPTTVKFYLYAESLSGIGGPDEKSIGANHLLVKGFFLQPEPVS